MRTTKAIRYPDLTFHTRDLQHGLEGLDMTPRGRLMLASCRSGSAFGRRVHRHYEAHLAQERARTSCEYLDDLDGSFLDSETFVRLPADVNGADVYLVQSLRDPTSDRSVNDNYMSLLIAARALREWGAANVTAVIPYLAYSRQDKPTNGRREPTSIRLLADLTLESGVDRVVTWHPHVPYLQAVYDPAPVVHLDPAHLFIDAFAKWRGREDTILVAPDAGAVKLVARIAEALDLAAAVVAKIRPAPQQAVVAQVFGDFTGKTTAIIIDDMIASGGTIEAVTEELTRRRGISEFRIGVSHNLCMPEALKRLEILYEDGRLPEMIVTNSVPQTDAFLRLPCLSVRDLADVLSRVINRVHHGLPVSAS
jgi:ribose-phosphate pyrophosphokinase